MPALIRMSPPNKTVDIGQPEVYLTASEPDGAMPRYSSPFSTKIN